MNTPANAPAKLKILVVSIPFCSGRGGVMGGGWCCVIQLMIAALYLVVNIVTGPVVWCALAVSLAIKIRKFKTGYQWRSALKGRAITISRIYRRLPEERKPQRAMRSAP